MINTILKDSALFFAGVAKTVNISKTVAPARARATALSFFLGSPFNFKLLQTIHFCSSRAQAQMKMDRLQQTNYDIGPQRLTRMVVLLS